MFLKLQDRKSQYIFSTNIVNVSMAMYMRNKAYTELRARHLVALPSQEVLKKHLSVVMPTECICPISMLFMQDIYEKNCGIVEGRIMMDEIKLESGIM